MLHIITNRDELYHAVQVLSHLYNCSHTSVARTKQRNKFVGGSPTSQHQIGAAWDLVPDKYTNERAEAIVKAFKSMGCWAIDEKDHIHVQLARKFLNAGEYIY